MPSPIDALVQEYKSLVARTGIRVNRTDLVRLQEMSTAATQHDARQASELERRGAELAEARARLEEVSGREARLGQELSTLTSELASLRQTAQSQQQRMTEFQHALSERDAQLRDREHLRRLPAVVQLVDEARQMALEAHGARVSQLEDRITQLSEEKTALEQSAHAERQQVAALEQALRARDAQLRDREHLRRLPAVVQLVEQARSEVRESSERTEHELRQAVTRAEARAEIAERTLTDPRLLSDNHVVRGLLDNERARSQDEARRRYEALVGDAERLRVEPKVVELLDEARDEVQAQLGPRVDSLQRALAEAQGSLAAVHASLEDGDALRRHPTVQSLIEAVEAPLVSRIRALETAADEQQQHLKAARAAEREAREALAASQGVLRDEVTLQTNPIVQRLIEGTRAPLEARVSSLEDLVKQRDRLLDEKEGELSRMAAALEAARAQQGGPAPSVVSTEAFQRLMADTVSGLQGAFNVRKPAQTGAGPEIAGFVVDEVEVTTAAIVEAHDGQPVFVLPTRDDLKKLRVDGLSRVRFRMLQVPD